MNTITLSAALVAATSAVNIQSWGFTSHPVYAGLGENCLGFDENTGEAFPKCEEGLECEIQTGFHIPGTESICVNRPSIDLVMYAQTNVYAKLGDNCLGYNENTGEAFPKCEQ